MAAVVAKAQHDPQLPWFLTPVIPPADLQFTAVNFTFGWSSSPPAVLWDLGATTDTLLSSDAEESEALLLSELLSGLLDSELPTSFS